MTEKTGAGSGMIVGSGECNARPAGVYLLGLASQMTFPSPETLLCMFYVSQREKSSALIISISLNPLWKWVKGYRE